MPDDPAFLIYTSGTTARSERRLARSSLGIRQAADVSGLVRHRTRRPHAARRRFQLDVHARRRTDRPMGKRRNSHRLHRRQTAGTLARPHRGDGRDAFCGGSRRLSSNSEIRAPRTASVGPAASWIDGRRNTAAGTDRRLDSRNRAAALRSARHERNLDLHLDRTFGAASPGNRRQTAARPPRRNPSGRPAATSRCHRDPKV